MDNVTSETKLQLLRQIRSRYSEDQYDLTNRERLLYGKSSDPERYGNDSFGDEPSSFRLRLFLSVALLGLILFMDRTQTAIGGITAEKCYAVISADYEDKLQEWVAVLSGSVR